MLSFFSTFTGAGGADLGAIAAGLTPIGGIELEQYPVDLYRANFGNHVRHESILDTPLEQLPDFDFFWTSPVCKSFSVANPNKGELQLDIDVALKVAEIIKVKNPRYIAIENVRAYEGSDSFKLIAKAIHDEGYNFDWRVYDAANFGVPQNRDRLIVRASRDRLPILETTHSKRPGFFHKPWNGWYDAIKHILASCKDTHLTKNQMKSLENKGWENIAKNLFKSVLIEGANAGRIQTIRSYYKPSFTGTANMDRQSIRAVMVERTGYDCDRGPTVRLHNEPCQTIRSSVGCDGTGGFRSPITALIDCEVKALDYRCLAAFQTFPDSYKWGPKSGGNCKAIGNAVAVKFAEAVIRSIINV